MKISIYLGVILIGGCAYLTYLQHPFTEIPNFHQVDEYLFRGGRPKEEGFRKLASLGIKTLISLKEDERKIGQDKRRASGLGFKFYNIPLSVYKMPTDNDVFKFLEIVLNKENQPVFVYCSNGKDRVGAMVALYRVVVCGWQPKQAYKEAKHFGFWPYYGEAELKKFIHQLKDKKIYFEKAREYLRGS
ncbi:MAG TPA: hypothetical protein EYP78_01965 [Candidatus Omnitrophica bacterium]|nr:hypothetical protein [Candidatus Omnitrophota bacterium]